MPVLAWLCAWLCVDTYLPEVTAILLPQLTSSAAVCERHVMRPAGLQSCLTGCGRCQKAMSWAFSVTCTHTLL